jgi:hypothetical protein
MQRGVETHVLSTGGASLMPGAQYLHAPIPGTPSEREDPRLVRYEARGSADAYRRKVYGTTAPAKVSVETMDSEHHSWDIRASYNWLREKLETYSIREFHASPSSVYHLLYDSWLGRPLAYDYVISSVPAPHLCSDSRHEFLSQTILVGQFWAGPRGDGNHVICDGTRAVNWYRTSRIYGHVQTEWSPREDVGSESLGFGIARARKPLKTTCDCFLAWPNFRRVGRYGKWEKGVLTHQAFEECLAVPLS